MTYKIQLRRDTAANWTVANPVLAQGELGVETDTDFAKIGDGVTRWNSLTHWAPSSTSGAVASVNGHTGVVVLAATDVGADASGAATAAQAASLQKSSNLSDLASAATARTNLGLGTAAVAAIDATATDIQASPGTQAAGATGQVADAAHVHPQPSFFAPTGLTGATAVSRYIGAVASGIPVSGTFATGDWGITRLGTVIICTAGGTPGTWVKLGQIDTTAGDIAALGAQAAGAVGKVADAGHVHPTTGLSLSSGYNQTQSATPSATLGVYGTPVTFSPNSGMTGFFPTGLIVVTTGLGSETVTMQVTGTFKTGGAGTPRTSTVTTNTTSALTNSLLFVSLFANNDQLVSIAVQVKSTINSSAASASFNFSGINCQ